MDNTSHDGQQLCYLEASRVESPEGDLGGLMVQTQADETLGKLNGVLIDPQERRLRYYVVETPGLIRKRRYLISADHPVSVEQERNTLRVDTHGENVVNSDEFDLRTVREFSPEDAVAAMFRRAS